MGANTVQNVLACVGYSALGVVTFVVAMKAVHWVLPFDVNKELAEDHNTAVGILLGSMMIGLSIIIAAAIH